MSLHSYTSNKIVFIFSICGGEIKAFCWCLETIDNAIASTIC